MKRNRPSWYDQRLAETIRKQLAAQRATAPTAPVAAKKAA